MADPTGTALVVAGKTLDHVLSPKLREYLLGPVFKAYGNAWGEDAEERIRRRRAKAVERAEQHMIVAARVGPGRSYDDLADEPEMDEWAAGASQVDEAVDPELASFWRAALVAIRSGDGARARLLAMVKRLEPDDAIFLAMARRRARIIIAPKALPYAAMFGRLAAAGVVEGSIGLLKARPQYAIAVTLMPMLVYVAFRVQGLSLPHMRNLLEPLALPAALATFVVGGVALIQSLVGPRRYLTSDGKVLLEHLARVRAAEGKAKAAPSDETSSDGDAAGGGKKAGAKRRGGKQKG
ncbi:hypothetical protein SGCZBJ_20335 [Caulobacter zeae]|uniref:Uncharacterized protein n=1 Tax=Caulobacter zeae TaxID=2055137 RepID=A0A2N5D783_9CAUL|nr:hypothetical protein [Caulobacter zeae]PLR21917.1 hypothetical protein SGCZBJ_20335 [Caulobacter zeae]